MKQLTITGSNITHAKVSQLGLGTMRMNGNKAEGIKAIHTA